MSTEGTCHRCGGSSLESGKVQSTGRIHFHFENARFLATHPGYVSIFSTMCMDCGIIDMVGEVSKARKITGQE